MKALKILIAIFVCLMSLEAHAVQQRYVERMSLYELFTKDPPTLRGNGYQNEWTFTRSIPGNPTIASSTLLLKAYVDQHETYFSFDESGNYPIAIWFTDPVAGSTVKYLNAGQSDVMVYHNAGALSTADIFVEHNASSYPVNLLKRIYIEAEWIVEYTPQLPNPISGWRAIMKNERILTATNELELSWRFDGRASYYELEYLFMPDAYDAGAVSHKANIAGQLLTDFSDAVKVVLTRSFYTIPLAFPQGSLLYRVRPVYQNSTGDKTYGRWSYEPTATSTLQDAISADVTTPCWRYLNDALALEPMKNWQHQASFIENGLRKDVVSFFDGSGRSRQTATVQNADAFALVQEEKYDYEGRKALSIIPGVTASGGLGYYSADNGGAANNVSKSAFFSDNAIANGTSFTLSAANSISAKYYSPSNNLDFINKVGVADAEGVVGAQTVFMNDGTDRPAVSSGIGGTLGFKQGHDTKMLYGKPTQAELDRLFGNEVGEAQFYTKSYTIDPNGQVSVQYLDHEGRVIASCLSGDVPAGLLSLQALPAAQANPQTLKSALLSGNNTVNSQGAYIQANVYVFDKPGTTVNLEYTLSAVQLSMCSSSNPTYQGLYNIEITVLAPDESTVLSQTYTLTPSENRLLQFTVGNPGRYTITRTISLDETSIQTALANERSYLEGEQVMVNNTCIPYNVDPVSGCDLSLANCSISCYNYHVLQIDGTTTYIDETGKVYEKQEIGGTDYYVDLSDPAITYLVGGPNDPIAAAIAACELDCADSFEELESDGYEDNTCAVLKAGLMADMSPGGQFFSNMAAQNASGQAVTDPNGNTVLEPFEGEVPEDGWLINNITSTQANNLFQGFENSTGGTYTSWADVAADWHPEFAEQLIVFHPEYCAYYYFCLEAELPCASVNMAGITAFKTHIWGGTTEDYATGANGASTHGYNLLDPLGLGQNLNTNGPGGNNEFYVYAPGPNTATDPLFGTNCTNTGSLEYIALQSLTTRLTQFIETDPGKYFSLWYVLLNPDGIDPANPPPGLSADVVSIFNAFHNPTTGLLNQQTVYEVFRSVYTALREQVIYTYFRDHYTCPASSPAISVNGNGKYIYWNSDTDYDAHTEGPPAGPGVILNYPKNVLIETLGSALQGGNYGGYSSAGDIVSGLTQNPADQAAACKCTKLLTQYGITAGTYTQPDAVDIANNILNDYGVTISAADMHTIITECLNNGNANGDYTLMNTLPEDMNCGSSYTQPDEDCVARKTAENLAKARQRYLDRLDEYMRDKEQEIRTAVRDNLLNNETLDMSYDLREYAYTLYYYDRAGNLIKTVPPKGVNFFTEPDDLNKVVAYRAGTSSSFMRPAHSLYTKYVYNSQNQLIRQYTPDGSNTEYWYDQLARLVFSVNKEQEAGNKGSYTLYDEQGRIRESGELTNVSAPSSFNERNLNESQILTILDAGSKRDVNFTTYGSDLSDFSNAFSVTNRFLDNRVAQTISYTSLGNINHNGSVTADPSGAAAYTTAANYQVRTAYSYDLQGNVNQMVSRIEDANLGNRYFRLEYSYDLLSGNVKQVALVPLLESGGQFTAIENERFYHKYRYDADNRLVKVWTSRDGLQWQKEAKYFYYPQGALARTELGEALQGTDHSYTLQGWLKQINGALHNQSTGGNFDLGADHASGTNRDFVHDQYVEMLGYYDKDYASIGSNPGEPSVPLSLSLSGTPASFWNTVNPLYNGNISHVYSSYINPGTELPENTLKAYAYDQLNRLRSFDDFVGGAFDNTWNGSHYGTSYAYDLNGNFTRLQRDGPNITVGDDVLDYYYYANSNKLEYVSKNGNMAGGINPQSAGNYTYDLQGNLKGDVAEGLNTISWRADGKIERIAKSGDDLEFMYDPMGNRAVKTVGNLTTGSVDKTYYIRDAQGNPLALYLYDGKTGSTLVQKELYLYGSSRLGALEARSSGSNSSNSLHTLTAAHKTYELSNHLGNVMATLSAQKDCACQDIVFDFEINKNLEGLIPEGTTIGQPSGGVWSSNLSDLVNTQDDGRLHVTVRNQNRGFRYLLENLEVGKTYTIHIALELPVAGSYVDLWLQEFQGGPPWGQTDIYAMNQSGVHSFTFNPPTSKMGLRLRYTDPAQGNPMPNPGTFYVEHIQLSKNENQFVADLQSAQDYYPFGMQVPGRILNGGDYRFSFQGQEQDDEVKGAGNSINFKYRMHDPRIGRFLSLDPLSSIYPHNSPYAFAENKVIQYIELEGAEVSQPAYVHNSGYTTAIDQTGTQAINEQKELQKLAVMSQAADREKAEMLRRAAQSGGEMKASPTGSPKHDQQLAINTYNLNNAMEFGVPGYELFGKITRGEEITDLDIGIEIAGIIPFGRIVGKVGGAVAKSEFTEGAIKELATFFKNNSKETIEVISQRLNKAINSHTKQIAKHKEYLADPKLKYGDNWDNMSKEHKDNVIHHWEQDIKRHEASKEIKEKALEEL